MSSGESEYYAMLKASATGLALKAMLEDWGISFRFHVLSDSSAARGLVARRGLGKARHIQTRFLWLQERVAEKDLQVVSVPTDVIIADLFTKGLTEARILELLQLMNLKFRDGRASTAKRLIQTKL